MDSRHVSQSGIHDSIPYVAEATPKSVLKLMGIQGLTLYHLKSHLQKYRLSKNLHAQASSGSNKTATGERLSEASETHLSNPTTETQAPKNLHLGEAIQMQIEVQRRLHEQLEVQRHLQLRIEAQGKYLQSVLEKAQETLGRQNMGTISLEAAKVHLSDLVSKVSTQCLDSVFPGMKELSNLSLQQTQAVQPADCSMDSCLTSCEGSLRDQELYNIPMGTRPIKFSQAEFRDDDNEARKIEHRWHENLKESRNIFPKANDNGVKPFVSETKTDNLSMSIGLEGGKWNDRGNCLEERLKGTETDAKYYNKHSNSNGLVTELKLPLISTKLDLNADDENDASYRCKQLDLNGFSWA